MYVKKFGETSISSVLRSKLTQILTRLLEAKVILGWYIGDSHENSFGNLLVKVTFELERSYHGNEAMQVEDSFIVSTWDLSNLEQKMNICKTEMVME